VKTKTGRIWAVVIAAIMVTSVMGILAIGTNLIVPNSGEGERTNSVPRCVMYEQFTNWHCGICTFSEAIYPDIVENYYGYTKVAPVFYHYPSVTDDPAWLYNPIDNWARSEYYNVSFLPTMELDGLWYPANPDEVYFKALVDERLAIPSNISISASSTLSVHNLTGRVSATIEAVEDIVAQDLVIHFALWEHKIPVLERFGQPAPNGMDPWHWTMWDMMPDGNGEAIWPGGIGTGATIDITHDFILEPEWDIDELGISIWIQSNGTRLVEQAHVVDNWNIIYDYDIPVPDPGSTPGWRFVSFPLDVTGDAQTVFNDTLWGDGFSDWDCIQWYDPNGQWKSYSKFKPDILNDLPDPLNTMGFWVHLTTNTGDEVLTIGIGPEATSVPILLKAGWNMVGYPAKNDSAYNVTQLMADTGATAVEGYNALAVYRLQALNGDYVLKCGEGYWIKVNSDTTWTVDW
jgi:hypothetical protein